MLIERERLQQTVPSVVLTGHRNPLSGGTTGGAKHSAGRSVSAGNLPSSTPITVLLRYVVMLVGYSDITTCMCILDCRATNKTVM